MLRGDKVGLRARYSADVPILHAELYDDIETRSRADTRPWTPIGAESGSSPYATANPTDTTVCFSVLRLEDGELAGEALLWDIDQHNRSAHVGISLRPSFRGQGLGSDAVRVLATYAFRIRGLHRLQVETLADNTAMVRVAASCGFTPEGRLKDAAWVDGGFVDEVVLGLLAESATKVPG
ncbi:MAG: GNAT family N-acetyltransferase [Nocardioidaceae bacterium]